MRLYLLYLFTATTNCYMLMLFLGVSAGFASYIPLIAFISCTILFVVAAPALAINARCGIIIGAICCLGLLPYNIAFIAYMIRDKSYHTLLGSTAAIPAIFYITTLYSLLCIRTQPYKAIKGRYPRLAAAIMPIAALAIYQTFICAIRA